MLLSENEIHNRIIDYLSGELTETDNDKVELWINESEENRLIFKKIELIWTNQYKTQVLPNQNWSQISQEIQARQVGSRLIYFKILAAALVILLVGFAWMFNSHKSVEPLLQTNKESFITDTLNNGWVVYLYPNSKLTKSRKFFFKKEELAYKFSGEGFFIVPENNNAEITISIGDANLQVNGASFRVNSCSKENDFSVLVESGKLDLKMNEEPNNALLINAGEEGFYSCSKKTMWKNRKNDEIYLIYQPKVIDM